MAAVDFPQPIRRIVTEVNASGVGAVLFDDHVRMTDAPEKDPTAEPAKFGVAWQTDSSPADVAVKTDGANLPSGELINSTGSVIRFVDFPPHHSSPMHRTESIDYGIVLYGEITLELDDGSKTELKPSDCVVQQSSDHAWHNYSDKWARMVYVLLPAHPVIVNGKALPLKGIAVED